MGSAHPARSAPSRPAPRLVAVTEIVPMANQSPISPPLPEPLHQCVTKARQALVALAGPDANRRDMHDFRGHLSDLCALTVATPNMMEAIAQVVDASDCFAEVAPFAMDAPERPGCRERCFLDVWSALQVLNTALVEAKPSRIALELGRAW